MFKKADLLPDYRTKQVESIINKMAERVVQVKGTSISGSGIIFKANDEFYLQTCVHVIIALCPDPEHDQALVPQGTQCKKCEYIAYADDNVEVCYKDRFGETSYITRETTKLVAMCESSEKAIFAMNEVPQFIKESDMEDLRWLVVNIRIQGNVKMIKGLLEVHKTESRDPTFIIRSAERITNGTECYIVFYNKEETRCTGIEQCCGYCSWLSFDPKFVPIEAKNYFFKGLPWETTGEQQVVLITYAEEKEIRFGKPVLDPDHNQDCLIPCEDIRTPIGISPLKKVVFLIHDVSVQGGDSGGCVFIIGKDTESSIGYTSYMCMHIAGNDNHGLSSIGLIN